MNKIEIWKEAQESESGYWKILKRNGITVAPDSLDRYKKCVKLLPLLINHSVRVLDVGSGPYGGCVPFFISEPCFKVSIDPLIGKKRKFPHKEITKEITLIRAIGEGLPFVQNTFSVIFCVNALDHSYKPLHILNEINRLLDRRGVFIMMVHIVTPRQKIIHFITYKTRFRRFLFAIAHLNRLLSAPTRVRHIIGVTNASDRVFKSTFGLKIISDGILHPFYFTLNDVVTLLHQAGFAISKIRLYPSQNNKKELFLTAHKHEKR